jgi:hypothetical protein
MTSLLDHICHVFCFFACHTGHAHWPCPLLTRFEQSVDIDDAEVSTEVGIAEKKRRGKTHKEKRREKKLKRTNPRNQVRFPERKQSRRREPRI